MLSPTVCEYMALKKPQKCQMAHAGIAHAPAVLSPGGQSSAFTVAEWLLKTLLGQTSL